MKFYSKSRGRGFTLVELLITIAIIGVLSAIVNASLLNARKRSDDAAVRRALSQVKGAAAELYDSAGIYDTFCESTTKTGELFRQAYDKGTKNNVQNICVSSGTSCLNGLTTVACSAANPDKWAVSVQLKGRSGYWFCADYTGIARDQRARGIDYSPVDVDC